jgi:hypothetical protein
VIRCRILSSRLDCFFEQPVAMLLDAKVGTVDGSTHATDTAAGQSTIQAQGELTDESAVEAPQNPASEDAAKTTAHSPAKTDA